jgi:thiol-disulfide isomerase/thioredoxin
MSMALALSLITVANPAMATKASPKPLVMVFWASWCNACNNALAALSELDAEIDNSHFLAVNVLDEQPVADSLVKKGFEQLRWLDAGDEYARHYGVTSLPWVIIKDSQRQLLSSQPALGTATGIAYQINGVLAVQQTLAAIE